MDIQAEKLHLIEQLLRLEDVSVINSVKELLQNVSKEEDELLEQSIDRGIKQSKSGEVMPHHEVMAALRSKYTA